MTIEGKGMFTWKLPRCENGDAAAVAATAKSANLSHVMVKIADGNIAYNGDWGSNIDQVPVIVNALQGQGIQAWGWHYVYGDDPIGEARIALRRIKQLQVDAYVIDAEGQYSKDEKKDAARSFMAELRGKPARFPDCLVLIPLSVAAPTTPLEGISAGVRLQYAADVLDASPQPGSAAGTLHARVPGDDPLPDDYPHRGCISGARMAANRRGNPGVPEESQG